MQQFKKVQVQSLQDKSKTLYTFRQVNKNKVDAYALAQNMQDSGSLTEGDAINATLSLPKEIAKALANNGEVTIKGFGTFSLSTAGTGSAERPEDITKADIKRSIAFTPAEEMLQIVRSAEIKIVKTSTVPAEEDTDTPAKPSEGEGNGSNQGNVLD